jgi:hypothetical protein
MKNSIFLMVAAAAVWATPAGAQQANGGTSRAAKAAPVPRTADGHPDLSGTWAFAIDLPPINLKKVVNGKETVARIDQSARHAQIPVAGALPSTPAPSYKPEFKEKVQYLFDHESKTDPVFYCGKPGVPRIGSPRRIIQLPREKVILYEDISGDPYRVIPTDGRAHRKDANPSAYGDSVAHWEGDTLLVDVTNFDESTWFGEGGYFHSDALHVTERLWRSGENLVWQATVDDPKVLTAPWTMAARVIKPSTEPLEESPRCVEQDSKLLDNNDHHLQR